MKRLLLLLLTMAVMPLFNIVRAQCDVQNVIFNNIRAQQQGPNVLYTMDISFILNENSGNKVNWIHLWLESEYNYQAWHVDGPYKCPPVNAAQPTPATYTSTPDGTFDMLDNAFVTFGFDLNATGIATSFPGSTVGVIQTYNYDPAVDVNWEGVTIYKEPYASGYEKIYIRNISFVKANCLCTDYFAVRAFNWATQSNASKAKAQCWSCSSPFIIGDPRVSGNVNCTFPRTYTIFIDSRFDNAATPGVDPIYGTYRLYVDLNRNGVVDGNDFLVKNTTSFTTTTAGVPSGFKSRYFLVNGTFDYNFEMGDTTSNKNIIAVVSVDNPEYVGADVSGILSNTCSILPVVLSNFTAGRNGNEVTLRWTAATESSMQAYEVERKTGNGNFEVIQIVPARSGDGALADVTYVYKDRLNTNETVLYRLRMVDLQGKAVYSDVRSVRMNGAGKVLIYPNPGRDLIQVILPADAGVMDLSLEDMSGKNVRQWNGITQQQMQLRNLQPGMYVLRIRFRNTGEQVVERVIVQ